MVCEVFSNNLNYLWAFPIYLSHQGLDPFAGQQLIYFVFYYIFAKAILPWGNGSQTRVCLHLKGSEVASREHSGYAGSNSYFHKRSYSMKSSLTLYHSLSPITPSCLGKHCLVLRRYLLSGFASIIVLPSQPVLCMALGKGAP